MPLKYAAGQELLACSMHDERDNFAVLRRRDGDGFDIAQFLGEEITKSVHIERDDVGGLILALAEFAPQTRGESPEGDAAHEPLAEFYRCMARVLKSIQTTLILEGHAKRQHPESLVDELLLNIRPDLKAAFRAIVLGLRRSSAPQSSVVPPSADR